MANYAFGNDLDGFYPTITREAYYRSVAMTGHPYDHKPDHYTSIGTHDVGLEPHGVRVKMRGMRVGGAE